MNDFISTSESAVSSEPFISSVSSYSLLRNTNSVILEAAVHLPLKPGLICVFFFIVSLSTKACKLDKEFTLISDPLLSINL